MKAFILDNQIRQELEVDRIQDDVTAALLPPDSNVARATVSTRANGVFCGKEVVLSFQRVFQNDAAFTCLVDDGKRIETGEPLVEIKAETRLVLSLERTLLNYLTLLCGTATLTRRFVDRVGNGKTRILATRKTIPGLRDLQLMAVKAGGGFVHRRSLSDGVLIKDNHVQRAGIESLLDRAKLTRSPLHRVELEVQSLEELDLALKNPPDIVMLDNFSTPDLKTAIERIANRCEVEISGGITLERIEELASMGAHYISVGALTHSAPALNLTLDFVQ